MHFAPLSLSSLLFALPVIVNVQTFSCYCNLKNPRSFVFIFSSLYCYCNEFITWVCVWDFFLFLLPFGRVLIAQFHFPILLSFLHFWLQILNSHQKPTLTVPFWVFVFKNSPSFAFFIALFLLKILHFWCFSHILVEAFVG